MIPILLLLSLRVRQLHPYAFRLLESACQAIACSGSLYMTAFLRSGGDAIDSGLVLKETTLIHADCLEKHFVPRIRKSHSSADGAHSGYRMPGPVRGCKFFSGCCGTHASTSAVKGETRTLSKDGPEFVFLVIHHMNAVLQIAELQGLIFVECDRKSLARLARTCKLFHDTALDLLWHEVEIWRVLTLMRSNRSIQLSTIQPKESPYV